MRVAMLSDAEGGGGAAICASRLAVGWIEQGCEVIRLVRALAPPQPAIINHEEFRLPYYGIPESAIGIHPSRISLKVMVAIGFLVAILVARSVWCLRRTQMMTVSRSKRL